MCDGRAALGAEAGGVADEGVVAALANLRSDGGAEAVGDEAFGVVAEGEGEAEEEGAAEDCDGGEEVAGAEQSFEEVENVETGEAGEQEAHGEGSARGEEAEQHTQRDPVGPEQGNDAEPLGAGERELAFGDWEAKTKHAGAYGSRVRMVWV